MSAKRAPIFDFTPLAQRVALLFPAYFVGILVVGLAILVVYYADHAAGTALLDVWRWVPAVFPAAALLLVVDLGRHVRVLRPSQIVGHRAAGVCTVLGSAFGIPFNHLWALPVATVVLCCALFLMPRGRALSADAPDPGGSRS